MFNEGFHGNGAETQDLGPTQSCFVVNDCSKSSAVNILVSGAFYLQYVNYTSSGEDTANIKLKLVSLIPLCHAEVRAQLVEQLKCLDQQCELRVQLLQDLQDFFRKKAEIEVDYSRNLEKLAERFLTKTRSTKDHLLKYGLTRLQSHTHIILCPLDADRGDEWLPLRCRLGCDSNDDYQERGGK